MHSSDVYLNAAILCSIAWFEEKLMVLSVVVGFQNISVSTLVGFQIRSRSKKFICPLFLCARLNFMSLCFWFLFMVRSGVYPFGVIYNQNIIHIAYVEHYVFGVEKVFYMFIFKVL